MKEEEEENERQGEKERKECVSEQFKDRGEGRVNRVGEGGTEAKE